MLEQTDNRFSNQRLAVAVRQDSVKERAVGRAVGPRPERRGHETEIVFADIHKGAKRPARAGTSL